MSRSDSEFSGSPMKATPPIIINKIHDQVWGDRRFEMREIASTAGISSEWEHTL